MAINALKTAQGRTLNSEEQVRYDRIIGTVKGVFVSKAIEAQNGQNYGRAAELLTQGYTMNTADTSFLYYAAGSYFNAGLMNEARIKYEQLLELGYTGISTEYYATNVANGEEYRFNTPEDRKSDLDIGIYTNPRDVENKSVQPDILKKLTKVYLTQELTSKAFEIISRLRKSDPDNPELILTEAEIALNLGDNSRYQSLVTELLELTPNDPILYFNLGITSAELGEYENAIANYKKAIEIDPNQKGALINLGLLYTQLGNNIVPDLNAAQDNSDWDKFDKLKEQRLEYYELAIPLNEKVADLDKSNINILRDLKTIYQYFPEMNEKIKMVNLKIKELEGN